MRRVEIKKQYIVAGLLFIIAIVTVGFALLQSSLSINGTVSTKSNSWNIYFDNIVLNQASVSKTLPAISNRTALSFNVELDKPGDLYEFSVDAVNDGSIDAMINNITATNLTVEQAKLIDLSYTYEDGASISSKDYLKASTRETIKVSVKYKEDVSSEDLPNSNMELPITITLEYVQADDTAKEREVALSQVSFAEDSWETIQKAVQSGDYIYKVGDTKTITLASHTNDCSSSTGEGASYVCNSTVEPEKQITVRVSNTTECTNGETSETACGFVVEFADIVEKHNMNKADATNTLGTNVGGWRDSAMRTYVNGAFYNALPSDLKEVISDTTVVSGHGSTSGETNFTTTDKLYLLSAHEVYIDGNSNRISSHDTSYNETRQLDYYANLGVTTNNYLGAVKQYNGSDSWWWLRSASSYLTNTILIVDSSGEWANTHAYYTSGVSPVFRIA